MSDLFETMSPGVQIQIPHGSVLRYACRECGLVLNLTFEILPDGRIGLSYQENPQATLYAQGHEVPETVEDAQGVLLASPAHDEVSSCHSEPA